MDPVLFICQALVHFHKRHNAFYIPEIVRSRLPLDVPVHRPLEQDCSENTRAGEAGAGNDARPHLVHERKHLRFVGPGALLDPVIKQRLGSAAAALVERRNEAGLRLDFLELLLL